MSIQTETVTIQDMLNTDLSNEPDFVRFEGPPWEPEIWTDCGTLKAGAPDPLRLIGVLYGQQITLNNPEVLGLMRDHPDDYSFRKAIVEHVKILARNMIDGQRA